jgi:hypothetical protein
MKIKPFIPVSEQCCRLGRNEWSIARLITLSKDLLIMEIPIEHLNVYNTYDKLTLREMVMHMKATNDADLDHPIILDEDGDIMDGRHRIMKTLLLELPTIKAVRFEDNPIPCRVNEAKP